jgi:hypothetical protein
LRFFLHAGQWCGTGPNTRAGNSLWQVSHFAVRMVAAAALFRSFFLRLELLRAHDLLQLR